MRMDILWTILISLTIIVSALLGLMVYVQTNYRDALKKVAAGKPQEALELFIKVIGWQGEHVPSLWQMALLNLSMDKTEAALKHLQKILAIVDKEPDRQAAGARWGVTESDVVSKLAWSLSKMSKRTEAVVYFRRLMELEPKNKEARKEAAKLLYALREYGPSIVLFDSVIQLDPADIEVYELLSHAHAAQGNHERAADILAKRLANDRTNVNMWIRLANLYRTAKDNNKQAEAWKVVTEVTEDNDPNHLSALVQIGKLAYLEKDYPKAIEHMRRAQRGCESGDPRTLKTVKYYLGRAMLDSGRKSESLAVISEVYEMDPDYKDVRDLLRDSMELLSDADLAQEVKKMRPDKFSALAVSIVQHLGFRPVAVESVKEFDIRVDARLEETGKDRNALVYFERASDSDVGELAIRTFMIECDERHVEHPVFLTTGGFTFEAQMKGKDHRMRLMPKKDFCALVRQMRTSA